MVVVVAARRRQLIVSLAYIFRDMRVDILDLRVVIGVACLYDGHLIRCTYTYIIYNIQKASIDIHLYVFITILS